ncbi:hypothetical protein FB45DRAFT_1017656 [Roridomyces roridus]|uniref:Uncharacterized protein n=1 Tax=Roridomyces roridus TaxID=1738132 RepID=A0AAD7G2C2_9AGAR|nr:hypothetical protein FB45DRAFT_1017656 [Roridomyces roridus]
MPITKDKSPNADTSHHLRDPDQSVVVTASAEVPDNSEDEMPALGDAVSDSEDEEDIPSLESGLPRGGEVLALDVHPQQGEKAALSFWTVDSLLPNGPRFPAVISYDRTCRRPSILSKNKSLTPLHQAGHVKTCKTVSDAVYLGEYADGEAVERWSWPRQSDAHRVPRAKL